MENIKNNSSEIAELIISISNAVVHIYEPLKAFVHNILVKEKEKKLIESIISKDFNQILLIIKKKWNQIFSKHCPKKLKTLTNRCIKSRNLAFHQKITTLEDCKRNIETLIELARLISKECEEKVNDAINSNLFETCDSKLAEEIWISLKEEGNKFIKEDRFTEAMASYTRAIQLRPREAVLYSNRAICELRLKMYNEAREDAEDAIEFTNAEDMKQIKHYRLLSEALQELKLFDEAKAACLKGLEMDRRDETLCLRLRNVNSQILLEQTGKIDKKKTTNNN